MTIHNPVGVKLSVKDLAQGWRFCFVEELMMGRPKDAKYQMHNMNFWANTNSPGEPPSKSEFQHCTYITQTLPPSGVPVLPVPPAENSDDPLGVLAKLTGIS